VAARFRAAVDWHAAISANDDFHGVFVRVAANRALQETTERNMALLRRRERLRFGTPPGRRSVTEHQRILRSARGGDAAAAAGATLANWQSLGPRSARRWRRTRATDAADKDFEPSSRLHARVCEIAWVEFDPAPQPGAQRARSGGDVSESKKRRRFQARPPRP
jgi:hypothetical protein